MANKLIISLSSNNTAFNNKIASRITCDFIKKKFKDLEIQEDRGSAICVNPANNQIVYSSEIWPNDHFADKYLGVKFYDNLEPVRKICMSTFGLERLQCYNKDFNSSSTTHVLWEDIPESIKEKYKRPKRGVGGIRIPNGNISPTDIISIISNDIFKRMDENSLSRAMFDMIKDDGYPLAIIINTLSKSDVTIGAENKAKNIRILSEDENDEYPIGDLPHGEFTVVIDGSAGELNAWCAIKNKIAAWMTEAHI